MISLFFCFNFVVFVTFFRIAPLTPELLPAVAELDKSCLGGIWSLDNYRQEMERPNSDLLVLSLIPAQPEDMADPDNSPILVGVGCLWSILEEAHITLLAIAPNYQGRGLGQAMLYQLLFCAWQRQLEWATLEVRVSNKPAISLYQKFGFQGVGRRRHYYQDTGEDALILWRYGLHHPEFKHWLAEWKPQICARLMRSGFRI